MNGLHRANPEYRTLPTVPVTVRLFAVLFELGLLAAFGYWGWHLGGGGFVGVVGACLLPTAAATIWIVMAAPGLSGRQQQPVIIVPGWLRLAIELGLIGGAAYGVWSAGSRAAAETLLTAAGLLFAVSWESARWLVRQ